MKTRFLFTTILLLFLSSCQSEKFEGNGKGAKKLLSRFLEVDADYRELTLELMPEEDDYKAYFESEWVDKVIQRYNSMWENPALAIKPDTSQVEIIIDSTTTTELKEWTGDAALLFPGGYKNIADMLKDSVKVYKFKFVKPGFNTGLSFDGLVYINERWVIFPKPWRVLK